MKKIFKMVGFLLLYVLAYLIACVIAAMGLMIILIFSNMAAMHGGFDINAFSNSMQNTMMKYTDIILLATSILAFGLIFVIFLIRKENLFKTCNFAQVSFKNTGILAVMGIALSVFVGFALEYVIELGNLQSLMDSYEKLTAPLMESSIIIVVLTVGVVAPVFEEIYFRGVIFNELRRNIPTALAVIIQGLIFALFHGNVIQGSYAFVVGVIFALVYIKLKSIWAPIILHVLFNNTSTFIDKTFTGELSDSLSLLIMVLSFLIAAGAFYYLLKSNAKPQTVPENSISA